MAFNLAEDATKKTLIKPLPNFIPNREEYKALMDNGLAYAKEFHLTPGVSLTKEQMAALTSDMVEKFFGVCLKFYAMHFYIIKTKLIY